MACVRLNFALIIFAVAHHDDGAPHRMVASVLAQFFTAGAIDGVVHRGAAAVVQTSHAGLQQANTVGEILVTRL